MIWEKMNHQAALLQEYRISDIDRSLVLKYNPLHRSARLTLDQFHRLVFLEGINSISGKTLIRNEYGLEVGSLSFSKSGRKNEGSITLDGKKFEFSFSTDNVITIYNKDNRIHFGQADPHFFPLQVALTPTDVCCLVIGLCWQVFIAEPATAAAAYAHA